MSESLTLQERIDDFHSPADVFIECFACKESFVSMFFPKEELCFLMDTSDLMTKTVNMNIVGNLVSKSYNTANASIKIVHRGLEVVVNFEQKSNSAEDAKKVMDALVDHIDFIDFLSEINGYTLNSFLVVFPREKYIKIFKEAWANDPMINLEDSDVDSFTVTISFKNTHAMMTKLKKLQLTFTITPTKDDNNSSSRVNWDTSAEKKEDSPEIMTSIELALKVYDFVISSLTKIASA